MFKIVVLVVTGVLLLALELFLLNLFVARRAYKTRPFSFKHGMVFDLVNKKLIGTTTPVYMDPKTGAHFLGKTQIDKNC